MDKDESGPERTCIVSRAKASPERMIRFVLGPDGAIVPDLRRRLPGRGVWVTAAQPMVADAVRKQAFSRALKTKLSVDAALPTHIGDLLAADALQSLAMANKAGRVVTGFAKIEAALQAGPVAALVHATEAADDGVRKLHAAWRRTAETNFSAAANAPIKVFSAEQLELALGRTNVIHVALASGPASQAFIMRCQKLISYLLPAKQDAGSTGEVSGIEFGRTQAEAAAGALEVRSFDHHQDQGSV